MPWGKGGSGGALTIKSEYIFTTILDRDNYFIDNPGELVEGLYVSAASNLYQYKNSAWVDVTPIVVGPKGADGADGADGTGGTGGTGGNPSISELSFSLGDTVQSVRQLIGQHTAVFNAINTSGWTSATITASRTGTNQVGLTLVSLDIQDGERSTAVVEFTEADANALAAGSGPIDFQGVAAGDEGQPLGNIHIGQLQVVNKFDVTSDGFGRGLSGKPNEDTIIDISLSIEWDGQQPIDLVLAGITKPLGNFGSGVHLVSVTITQSDWATISSNSGFPIIFRNPDKNETLYSRAVSLAAPSTRGLRGIPQNIKWSGETDSISVTLGNGTSAALRTQNLATNLDYTNEENYFVLRIGSGLGQSNFLLIDRVPLLAVAETSNAEQGTPFEGKAPDGSRVYFLISRQNAGGFANFQILVPTEFFGQSLPLTIELDPWPLLNTTVDARDIFIGKAFNASTVYPLIPMMFYDGTITELSWILRTGSITFHILKNGNPIQTEPFVASQAITSQLVDVDFLEADAIALAILTEPETASDFAISFKLNKPFV